MADTDYAYNVVGTSHFKCQCSIMPRSWLGHWEKATGRVRDKCFAKGCGSMAEVGAHVRVVGWDQRTTWIIPFCQFHNKRPDTKLIPLKWGTVLAAAAASDCS